MGQCSAHYIREVVLKEVVFDHLCRVLRYVQQFESVFVRERYEQSFEDRRRELAEMKREIIKANRRIEELNLLFRRTYEDNANGRLSDERYQRMSEDYDTEQQQLKLDVIRMEADVATGEEVNADFQQFLTNIRKYTDITELTPTILNEFISRIEVHAPDKSGGKRKQDIDIYYNAVGIINLPTEAEMDALEAEYRAQKQKSQQTKSA